MENSFKKLKTTTIKDFRIKFFEQFENNSELIKEFSKFTNLNNSMSLYDDFIKYSIKILQQKMFDEQRNPYLSFYLIYHLNRLRLLFRHYMTIMRV